MLSRVVRPEEWIGPDRRVENAEGGAWALAGVFGSELNGCVTTSRLGARSPQHYQGLLNYQQCNLQPMLRP
jgi:hypothetical protein